MAGGTLTRLGHIECSASPRACWWRWLRHPLFRGHVSAKLRRVLTSVPHAAWGPNAELLPCCPAHGNRTAPGAAALAIGSEMFELMSFLTSPVVPEVRGELQSLVRLRLDSCRAQTSQHRI